MLERLKPKIPNRKKKILNREAHNLLEGLHLLKIKTGIIKPEAELLLERESDSEKKNMRRNELTWSINTKSDIVKVKAGENLSARAFLGSGAQVSFITEEQADLLEKTRTFQ